MIMKPLLEKFLSCSEVEVLRINNTDFALKKINTKQAEYLNAYFEYFMENPDEFKPFIMSITIEADREKLKKFMESPEKIRVLIHAICIESLSLRPKSLDYTFSNLVRDLLEYPTIINIFSSKLISYGYKKSEIDEFSNNKIIRLALEETYLRSKAECLLFIVKFINSMLDKPESFPLSYKILETVKQKAEELTFIDAESREAFMKDFYSIIQFKGQPSNNQNIKIKSAEEIRQEIRAKQQKPKSRVSDLPK